MFDSEKEFDEPQTEESPSAGKSLLEYLRLRGLDEYGSVIPTDVIREVIGATIPGIDSVEDCRDRLSAKLLIAAARDADLKVLGATTYVRNVLLKEGKYLRQDGSNYRILLPSENMEQVERYQNSAMRKDKCALILYRNTKEMETQHRDHTESRIMMRMESRQNRSVFGAV